MPRYRKKPVVIEARQLTAGDAKELARWINGEGGDASFDARSDEVIISTLEGAMHATHGDYIIKGVANEFYPCKPAIFTATYELVEGGA